MEQRKTTIADVARLAGVGKMTVSRFLNGSAKVSEETAEKVHRAIKNLHYQPNEIARSLRGLNSKTIGVIVPYLLDPFFATCAHAISTVAKEQGYSVILTTSDENPEIEHKQAILMLRRQVNGLVMIPVAGNDHLYVGEAFSHIPIVSLDRPLAGPHFDSVLVANRAGAKAVVEHLIGHGHRNIAFLGLNRSLYAVNTRYAGYCDALAQSGYPPGPYLDCISQEKCAALIRSQLQSSQPPTAFFASNNLTMRYLLHTLYAERVAIPRRVAVAGFDDIEMADVVHPSITVIRQPVYQIGELAANLLFKRISGADVAETRNRVVLPVELILRGSCGCKARFAKSASDNFTSIVINPETLPEQMPMLD